MENGSSVKNSSLSLEELNRQEVIRHLPVLLVVLLILVIGVIGNTLVLLVYKFKLRRSSARVYIISLALADMLVCVVGIPYQTIDNVWIVNYTNANVCRSLSFIMVAGSFSSVFVLLVVGLDRFLKVCRPLKRQIKDFGDRKACIIAAVFGILSALPMVFLYGNASYETGYGLVQVNCFVDDVHRGSSFPTIYLSFTMLIFIGSVLFLITLYGFICRKIYEHDRMQGEISLNKARGFCSCTSSSSNDNDEELDEDQNNEDNDIEMANLKNNDGQNDSKDSTSVKPKTNENSTSGKRMLTPVKSTTMMRHTGGKKQENTRKITLMMFTITVVFIIAYLPFIVVSMLDSLTDFWEDLDRSIDLLFDFMLRIYIVNNAANPIIYCFWDKRFRKECVHVLRRVFCCKENGGDSKNSSSNSSSHTRYTLAT